MPYNGIVYRNVKVDAMLDIALNEHKYTRSDIQRQAGEITELVKEIKKELATLQIQLDKVSKKADDATWMFGNNPSPQETLATQFLLLSKQMNRLEIEYMAYRRLKSLIGNCSTTLDIPEDGKEDE